MFFTKLSLVLELVQLRILTVLSGAILINYVWALYNAKPP